MEFWFGLAPREACKFSKSAGLSKSQVKMGLCFARKEVLQFQDGVFRCEHNISRFAPSASNTLATAQATLLRLATPTTKKVFTSEVEKAHLGGSIFSDHGQCIRYGQGNLAFFADFAGHGKELSHFFAESYGDFNFISWLYHTFESGIPNSRKNRSY